MKLTHVVMALAATATATAPAYAQTGTITFNGNVTTTTCDVSFNGVVGTNPLIILPTVAAPSLKAGQSAGRTAVLVGVGGSDPACSVGGVALQVNPNRTAHIRNGRIDNGFAVNPAGNVTVGLRDAQDNLIDLAQGWTSPVYELIGGAELQFFAEYYADGADANPGNVAASLEYTLVYQ